MDDHQRGDKRVTINKEFESFDAFVHEYVTNVSRSGVFIRSKEPMPVGTEVVHQDLPAQVGIGAGAVLVDIQKRLVQIDRAAASREALDG